MTEIKTSADFVSPPATPTGHYAATPEAEPNDVELRKLLALLTKGDEALAKRKDLTELHKRIVTMFTTLNQGLVEGQTAKAQQDRVQLVQRLDEVERAINSMEGALRIELEPLIRNIVAATVSQNKNPQKISARHWVGLGFVLCGGIALGAYYGPSIDALAHQTQPAAGVEFMKNDNQPSPIGGIAQPQNHVE